ncbi:MAG: response regulator [Bacteroidota bacterium]
MFKHTILLIDDDPDDQELFCELIHDMNENYYCVTANDGREAIDLLLHSKENLPRLILLDLHMPRMNGFEFLKVVSQDEQLNSIPIVVYATSKQLIAKLLETPGINNIPYDVIVKPLAWNDLKESLTSVIERLLPTYVT